MSSRTERPVGKVSAQTMFYLLALGSGFMRALSVAFDYVALYIHEVTHGPGTLDVMVYGFGAQWVSFAVTVASVALLSVKTGRGATKRPLGYSLDPDFGRLRLLPGKAMKYALAAGAFAGISTTAYYYLIAGQGADSLLPFGQLVIVYLLVGDLMAEKDTPTIVEVQCVLSILFGVILVGMNPDIGGLDPLVLLIVLLPMNLSSAFTTYYQKKAKKHEISPGLAVDTLNLRVWSLLALNTVFSVGAFVIADPTSWSTLAEVTSVLFVPMALSSLATLLTIVMYVRALARGSMAIVNSLSAVSVVLGIPISMVGSLLAPDSVVFGPVSTDVLSWILKVVGVTLVVLGIVALESSDVRAIVIINVGPMVGDILPELFSIKGVESASALAGKHDYLL
ncbi:MAG: hypothetical protein QXQ81_09160, partial [Candidatus Thorarchaeota archaeon]